MSGWSTALRGSSAEPHLALMTQPPWLSHPALLLFAVQHCNVPRRGINKNLGFVPLQCVLIISRRDAASPECFFVRRMALFFLMTHVINRPISVNPESFLISSLVVPPTLMHSDCGDADWTGSDGPTEVESLRFQA